MSHSLLTSLRRGLGRTRWNELLRQRQLWTPILSSVPTPKYLTTKKNNDSSLFMTGIFTDIASVQRAAEAAVAVCYALVEELNNTEPGVEILYLLDEISDNICKVIDAAEFLRNAHDSEVWREEVNLIYNAIASYMYQLNTDIRIYNKLCEVTNNKELMNSFNEEQKKMVISLRREFERDGIGMSEEQRVKIVEANSKGCVLAGEFAQGTQGAPDDSDTFSFVHPNTKPEGLVLSKDVKREMLADGRTRFTIPNAMAHTSYLYYYNHDEEIRKQAYLASLKMKYLRQNIPKLQKMLETRAEIAGLCGFDSYSTLVTASQMAGTPENAIEFLRTMAKAILPVAARDWAALTRMKAIDLGVNGKKVDILPKRDPDNAHFVTSPMEVVFDEISKHYGVRLHSWDVSHYLDRMTRTANSSNLPEEVEASQYLSLSQALEGLSIVCKEAFGLTLKREPLQPGEAWYDTSLQFGLKGEKPVPILKFVLSDDIEGDLGTFYLDPYQRPGKYAGACHFVIRCSKSVPKMYMEKGRPMVEMMLNAQFPLTVSKENPDVLIQKPIIVLVTDFEKPPSNLSSFATKYLTFSSTVNADDEILKNTFLQPNQLENLFHEFGHAIHSFLSRTQFQNLSGTRGALDFVELPSHIFEYWARDWRSVRRFAKNSKGDPMPEELWNRYLDRLRSDEALRIMSSITCAISDLALHSSAKDVESILQGPNLSVEEAKDIARRAIATVETEQRSGVRKISDTSIPKNYLSPNEMIVPLGSNADHTVFFSDSKPKVPLVHGLSKDPLVCFETVQSLYSLNPPVKDSQWIGGFNHLNSYGSGYYSYV